MYSLCSFRGGLDTANDQTGEYSYYTTHKDKEIMFHVSTLLPYNATDSQQVSLCCVCVCVCVCVHTLRACVCVCTMCVWLCVCVRSWMWSCRQCEVYTVSSTNVSLRKYVHVTYIHTSPCTRVLVGGALCIVYSSMHDPIPCVYCADAHSTVRVLIQCSTIEVCIFAFCECLNIMLNVLGLL